MMVIKVALILLAVGAIAGASIWGIVWCLKKVLHLDDNE